MKQIFCLFTIVFSLNPAFAQQNLCTNWERNDSTCIIGAGREGETWVRSCEDDPLICKRNGRLPDPTICKATTICVGRNVNPNSLTTDCTAWEKGDSSYSCDKARENKWVRSCQWHNLETEACSIGEPAND